MEDNTLTAEQEAELRAKFREMAGGPLDKLRDMASALHMGMQVTDMVHSLTVAKDRMAADGIGTDYKPMAINQVRYKPTGQNFQISVVEADEASMASFEAAMAGAKPLDEGLTRH